MHAISKTEDHESTEGCATEQVFVLGQSSRSRRLGLTGWGHCTQKPPSGSPKFGAWITKILHTAYPSLPHPESYFDPSCSVLPS